MTTSWNVESLRKDHDRAAFDCGEPSLNKYLAQYAGQNDRAGIGRTFVAVAEGALRVKAFYTLSASSVVCDVVPGLNIPYPVPVAHLGRLAVDVSVQGQRLGEFLMLDALRRTCRVSSEIAVYAVTVDALNERAQRFYEKYGFLPLLDDSRHLFLPMKQIRKLSLV